MIIVCGEALFDVFMRPSDDTIINMQAICGGSPYNVAIGLARLGSRVGFFGGLSSDPLGLVLRRALAKEGVETDQAPVRQENTTLALVQLDASGLPQYAFYGEKTADRQLAPRDIPAVSDDVKLLHFGSFSLVVEPVDQTLRAFALAQAGQRLIAYDPNIRPTVVADMEIWRASLHDWLEIADIVKVSHEDLDLLFPGQDPEVIVRSWLDHAPSLVVLTKGEHGAVGFCHQGRVHVPASKIAVTDTVGAGDSFQAALLHGLNKNGRLEKSEIDQIEPSELADILRFAVLASGVTCTRKGADLPRESEL